MSTAAAGLVMSPSLSVSQSSLVKNKAKPSLPTSSIFSFKAPLPSSSSSSTSASTSGVVTPAKQRRVSMAMASSPRVVPESAWSFRDDTGIEMHVAETCLMPEKKGKMRKIATDADEETGVKKQRKRWTQDETQMLVDGCNKHGVGNWKTILGDPEFTFDNRSPVDLKDRFRTYFPDAYKQHYPNARTHLSSKVRSTLPDGSSLFEKTRSKKRRPFTEEEDRALKAGYEKHGTVWATIVKDPIFQAQNRRSTDLRDRFRNAYPDLYEAAGYKPRNAAKKKPTTPGESSGSTLAQARIPIRAATDDQLSMSTTATHRRKRRNTSQGLLRGGTKSVPQSATPSEDEDSDDDEMVTRTARTTRSNSSPLTALPGKFPMPNSIVKDFMDDDDMGLISMDTDTLSDSLALADFPGSNSQSEVDAQSQTWSSGLDTPTHSHNAWAGSPTSSHLSSDYLLSSQSSPFQGRNEGIVGGMGMIGKSAWGTQDWFSANPRLDSSGSMSSPLLDGGLSPASPFSLHHLNHGIFERYDLMPTANPHDFSSEVGIGESRSTFSDEMFPPSSGFRGFTHHSDYAGDLIFGARTHQPQNSYYGSDFGADGRQTMGLGLSGMGPSAGINPMQLHTPALPGIDEIELTGITLEDRHNGVGPNESVDDSGIDVDILDLGIHSPPKEANQHKHLNHVPQRSQSVMSDTRLNLDDIVDMSGEAHITPPATPVTQSRQLRKRSLNYGQFSSHHGRSISVPPGEKNVTGRPSQIHHANSQPDVLADRRVFRPDMPSPISIPNSLDTAHQPQEQTIISSPIRHNPPSFSSLFLAQVSQSAHLAANAQHTGDASTPQAADMNHVPFLDLHYGGIMPPPMMDESQNYRQALDLAQSLASSLPKTETPTGFSTSGHEMANSSSSLSGRRVVSGTGVNGVGVKGVIQNGGHVIRGRGMGPSHTNGMIAPSSILPSRMMSTPGLGHHRGQSAVNPQDLMLRSDNKRKRASWDGAHILDSC
ncbi:hypothetical protein VNI00_007015 [Paramarasmius palmivorus]|uniref:Meiotically up-regulated gene 152 protein n=1 Tax=Paramarasmius palmivorus TaxID=297713 RepID=A0AAW0D5E8_9AGAR